MMSKLDRREFLQRAALLGAALAGAGALATACTKTEDSSEATLSCENPEGLEAAAKDMREQQNYVDESPFGAEKNCINCTFYVAPENEGECGKCTVLMNSPVHPEGYCDLWAALTA